MDLKELRAKAASLPLRPGVYQMKDASGTIIYTIVDDMIPETHEKEENQLSSLAFIVGFCLIMVIERFG